MSYLKKYVFQNKQNTDKGKAKAMTQHISCDYKCKFNSTTCNLNHIWNSITCRFESKNYRKCKEDYSWYTSTVICENSKYLKSIAYTSVFLMKNKKVQYKWKTMDVKTFCIKNRTSYYFNDIIKILILVIFY